MTPVQHYKYNRLSASTEMIFGMLVTWILASFYINMFKKIFIIVTFLTFVCPTVYYIIFRFIIFPSCPKCSGRLVMECETNKLIVNDEFIYYSCVKCNYRTQTIAKRPRSGGGDA